MIFSQLVGVIQEDLPLELCWCKILGYAIKSSQDQPYPTNNFIALMPKASDVDRKINSFRITNSKKRILIEMHNALACLSEQTNAVLFHMRCPMASVDASYRVAIDMASLWDALPQNDRNVLHIQQNLSPTDAEES